MRRAAALPTAALLVAVGLAWRRPAAATPALISQPLTAGLAGTRTIESVTPSAFSSTLGQTAMKATLGVVVSETAVAGDATGWSITATASSFTDNATPTAHTMPASSVSDGANSVTVVGGGGTTTAVTSPGALSTAKTLFTNTGESAVVAYTGTYTDSSTLTLTPPNGTFAAPTGTLYTATLTVTLVT